MAGLLIGFISALDPDDPAATKGAMLAQRLRVESVMDKVQHLGPEGSRTFLGNSNSPFFLLLDA